MRPVLVLLFAVLVSGCTFKEIKPQMLGAETSPRAPASTIVVSDITVNDALWEPYRLHVNRGITEWYARNATT
jgi:hypothetical protein